ncbi:MAG: hypothetical protein K5643_07115 [Saccharofermentans sp.]|nr:hypothetical protein [Saccharofermentans sp.]
MEKSNNEKKETPELRFSIDLKQSLAGFPEYDNVIESFFKSKISDSIGSKRKEYKELQEKYHSGKFTEKECALLNVELGLLSYELSAHTNYKNIGLLATVNGTIRKISELATQEIARIENGDDSFARHDDVEKEPGEEKQSVPSETLKNEPAPQKAEKGKKKLKRKTRVIIGIVLLVIGAIELIGLLTGNLTVKNGGNVIGPAVIMTTLFWGGGLFMILFKRREE